MRTTEWMENPCPGQDRIAQQSRQCGWWPGQATTALTNGNRRGNKRRQQPVKAVGSGGKCGQQKRQQQRGVIKRRPSEPEVDSQLETMTVSQLSFCAWNVNGLSRPDKARCIAQELLAVKQFDVVGLVETHQAQGDSWDMDRTCRRDYYVFSATRASEALRTTGRGAGGLLLAVRRRAGLRVQRKDGGQRNDRLWVQIDYHRHTWYVCLVYLPCHSSGNDDAIQQYEAEMASLQREVQTLQKDHHGEICLMGDFNACTGQRGSMLSHTADGRMEMEECRRVSADARAVDTRGTLLLKMADSCQLVITNGLQRSAEPETATSHLAQQVLETLRLTSSSLTPTDANGGSATLRRWSNRPRRSSESAPEDRKDNLERDDPGAQHVLDYVLVSPMGSCGSWGAMQVRPELRDHVADALYEHVVTSVSDHVPICITYDLYSGYGGVDTSHATVWTAAAQDALDGGLTAAKKGNHQFAVRKTAWPLLRQVMGELSRGQRREWQEHFEARCEEALRSVHSMLDGWELQSRGWHGNAMELEASSGSAGTAAGELRQTRVDAVCSRFLAVIMQVAAEHLTTQPRRTARVHAPTHPLGADRQPVRTRPARRSEELEAAQQQHAALFRQLKSLDASIFSHLRGAVAVPGSGPSAGRTQVVAAVPSEKERLFVETKEAWCNSRRQLNALKARYDAQVEVREWEAMEKLHEEPSMVTEYWAQLRRLAGRSAQRTVVPMHTMDRSGAPGSTDVRQVLYAYTEHLYRMGREDESERGLFNEEHRRQVEQELRAGDLEQELVQERRTGEHSDESASCCVLDASIELHEVTKAVKQLRNGKAVGVDGVPIELIKLGGVAVTSALCRMLNLFLRYERTPREWSRGEISPLLKKPTLERRDPASYRPITLLTHLSKVYTSVIHARLSDWCERRGLLHEGVGGFRAKRSATDQAYTLYTLCKLKARRERRRSYLCFVDLTQAYDNVWRDGLWWKMRHEFGVTGLLLRVIRQLYESVPLESRYVLNGEWHTPWVRMERGLRQGCVLSPLLFNMYVNGICQRLDDTQCGIMHPMLAVQAGDSEADWKQDSGEDDAMAQPSHMPARQGSRPSMNSASQQRVDAWRALQRHMRVASLWYADDIVLIGDSAEELQGLLDALGVECGKWRLSLNTSKTRVMITHDTLRSRQLRRTRAVPAPISTSAIADMAAPSAVWAQEQFQYRGATLASVESFTYLGIVLQSDYQWTLHKTAVIAKARAALHMLAGLGIRARTCSVRAALRMWTTLVLPILDHGAVVWGQGEWAAADQLQAEAAAVILHTLPGTSTAALRGELGWHRLRARRDRLAVKYWSALLVANGASPARYRTQVYRAELYDTHEREGDGSSSQDDSCLAVRSEPKAACQPWSEYVRPSLVHHSMQHYWDEQHCVASRHYSVGSSAAAASVALDASRPDGAVAAAVSAVRRTRNYFALPLMTDWRRAAIAEQQTLWRSEIAALPTLDTYRLFKRRLELESYLQDGHGIMSISSRRAATDMARLRCGVHELAISTERRQRRPGQAARLPRELRACAWCEEQSAAAAAQSQARTGVPPHAGLDMPGPVPAAARAAPVEDEQHVLLHCPQYAQLRAELFADVLDMSSEGDEVGRHVLTTGPVRLAEMLSASGGPGGAASALAIVAGGVWSRLDEKPKQRPDAWRLDADIRQRCKLYIGRLMHCRRGWQRARLSRRRDVRSAQRQRTSSNAQAQRGLVQGQLRLGIGGGALLQPELMDNRRPAQSAWVVLPAGQSGHNAPQRTHNARATASARRQPPSIPAQQAARRQGPRPHPAGPSGSKADTTAITVPRCQRSIVTYMQLRGSAVSAAAARAPSAHLARGSKAL